MFLSFADALCRRLGPAWPSAALRRLKFGLAGLCDAAVDITVDCVVQKNELLRTLLLRLLCLLRFLRHVALQAMSEWRCRNDAHPNRHASHSDYYSNTLKTPNLLTNSLR